MNSVRRHISALGTTLLVAAACTSPAAAPSPTPGMERIEHVVVIFQENRSFDSLYGFFPGANGIDGAGPAARQTDRAGAAYTALPRPIDNTKTPAVQDPRFPDGIANGPFDLAKYVPQTGRIAVPGHRFYREPRVPRAVAASRERDRKAAPPAPRPADDRRPAVREERELGLVLRRLERCHRRTARSLVRVPPPALRVLRELRRRDPRPRRAPEGRSRLLRGPRRRNAAGGLVREADRVGQRAPSLRRHRPRTAARGGPHPCDPEQPPLAQHRGHRHVRREWRLLGPRRTPTRRPVGSPHPRPDAPHLSLP